jgi:hypothetical protein
VESGGGEAAFIRVGRPRGRGTHNLQLAPSFLEPEETGALRSTVSQPAMAIMDRFRGASPTPVSSTADPEKKPQLLQISSKDRFRPRIILMAVLVSMGGFIFGYDTGQISGFLEMPDFLNRFSDTTDPETGKPAFTNGRSGTIVGLVSQRQPAHMSRITPNKPSCPSEP